MKIASSTNTMERQHSLVEKDFQSESLEVWGGCYKYIYNQIFGIIIRYKNCGAVGMEQIIRAITEYLSRQPAVSAAYLFGSTAKGTARPDSDIDIAVLFAAGLAKEECFDQRLDIAGELEDITGKRIDVIDLIQSPLFLQHQVRKYGRLIVEKDRPYRIAYEVRSRREYYDFQYILERRNNTLLGRL